MRGFDRPNLFFEVYPAADDRAKRRWLASLLIAEEADYPPPRSEELARASRGSGIVDTALTKSARTFLHWRNRHGVHAAYYHGQPKASQRNAVHARFHEGAARALAATNAFGPEIDRADLRYALHYDAPPSLEAQGAFGPGTSPILECAVDRRKTRVGGVRCVWRRRWPRS